MVYAKQQHQIRHSIDRMIWFSFYKQSFSSYRCIGARGRRNSDIFCRKIKSLQQRVAVNMESDLQTILFFPFHFYLFLAFISCWLRAVHGGGGGGAEQRDGVWNYRYVSRIL